MKKIKWQEIIIESILIVFSILLALAVNQCQQVKKEDRDKDETLQNIVAEINGNINDLDKSIHYHQTAIRKLRAVENSEIKISTTIEVIRNSLDQGLRPPNLQSTSWNSAIVSNNIRLLDFETVKDLSSLYSLQNKGVEKTWETIAEFVFSGTSYDVTATPTNIQVLVAYLEELKSQEEYLKEKAIKVKRKFE